MNFDGKPVNRLELIDRLWERLQLAKDNGNEIVMVEAWELSWVLAPMKLLPPQANDTAALAFNVEIEATQRHAVQVRHVEDYLVRIDVNAETQPYREAGQE